jgi:hypothetical protein
MNQATSVVHDERGAALLFWALMLAVLLFERGLRRLVSRIIGRPAPSDWRTWFEEAKSQASVATSYATWARSELSRSNQTGRTQRLS